MGLELASQFVWLSCSAGNSYWAVPCALWPLQASNIGPDNRSFCSWRGRIVYIESIARVSTLSLSGKLLYHLRIADLFLVQWQELKDRFPRAVYAGRLY